MLKVRISRRIAWGFAVTGALALALVASVCVRRKGGGDLHARRVVLEREVQGLRAMVARLEQGQPGLPPGDVAISLADTLLRELLVAQLPLEVDADRYHIRLDRAEVAFRGSPLVTLEGAIALRESPSLAGELRVLGALEKVEIDPQAGTLRTSVAIDHVDLKKLAGVEGFVSGGTMDDIAASLRHQIEERLPVLTIPVRIEQKIELPAITTGPVRLDGAVMPLQVAVSQVLAVGGQLWVAVHVEPGDFAAAAAPK